MNETDRLVGLHDIRLPADAPYQLLTDLLAALGAGLLFALLMWPLLLWVTQGRTAPRSDIEAELDRLAGVPEDMRIPALLQLLEAQQPGKAKRFGADLYAPGRLPDATDIEALIRKGP